MKKKSTSQAAPARRSLGEGGFFNLRVLIGSVFCLAGVFIALVGAGLYLGSSKAQAQPGPGSAAPAANSANGPDVVRLVGPVRLDQHLKDLPYIPPAPQIEKRLRKPYEKRGASRSQTPGLAQFESLINGLLQPVPAMPTPLLTFDGINRSKGSGVPPDTNGDVGPNHYVQSVNSSFQVFDKSGNPLAPATTFNSFFAPLGNSAPCGLNQNQGDPFVFYDQLADRWVITDFAFPENAEGEPAPPFYECIGVSQTPDPTGAYFLYALQADPGNPTGFGDYPKFGLWPDAYYLTMNEFFPDPNPLGLFAVRVYALDRASLIAGGPGNAVGFTIFSLSGVGPLGRAGSLVPATFRTGDPPPAGQPEFLLAVDGTEDEILTEVKGWLFHVDFVTPANSTLGVGANHAPNALITVSGFLNAPGGEAGAGRVPQRGTVQELDTVGDRMMTPVVYQNRNGTESLWADKTVFLTFNGPTGIRWYQFDVTGGNFPATPVQQQDWSNGNDGLWRWMPSIAVDANGNVAIGYSVSSQDQSIFPGIRYAGRRATDPSNDLSQGEAIMTNGGGSQKGPNRWGDYTMTTIDPADGLSFWHTNEYYPKTADENWFTRVGKFQFGPMSTLGNISTRAFVQTGDNVMIGGFMVQGTQPKRVIIRAIGPELAAPPYNVPNVLADPTLELHDGMGALIASNNTWLHTIISGIITSNQVGEIQASGHAPGDPSESAIIADLPAGNYTAIVSGVNNTTGVALVEVYDLSPETDSILGNISARSFVQTGDNVMIGGFMVQGPVTERVIIRAIGPELAAPPYNVPNVLADPTLELYDGTGTLIASNNTWLHTIIGGIITSNQVGEIQASGHAPGDPSESAIIAELPAGNYTAIVRGVNNTTGVALVEVYNLQ